MKWWVVRLLLVIQENTNCSQHYAKVSHIWMRLEPGQTQFRKVWRTFLKQATQFLCSSLITQPCTCMEPNMRSMVTLWPLCTRWSSIPRQRLNAITMFAFENSLYTRVPCRSNMLIVNCANSSGTSINYIKQQRKIFARGLFNNSEQFFLHCVPLYCLRPSYNHTYHKCVMEMRHVNVAVAHLLLRGVIAERQ